MNSDPTAKTSTDGFNHTRFRELVSLESRRVGKTLKRWAGEGVRDVPRLALLPPFLCFVIFWSWVSIARVQSLTATVYDLGQNVQILWSSLPTTGVSVSGFLSLLAYDPVYVLLSPLAIGGNYSVVLVAQAIAIGLPVFPIYSIAKRALNQTVASYFIAICYLLYPPLAGIGWFDFHFESFFIIFFIGGYYLYITGRFWAAGVFLILAGETTFPYILLIVLFAIICIIELALRSKSVLKFVGSPQARFSVILFSVSLILLALHLVLAPNVSVTAAAHLTNSSPPLDLDNVVLTVFVILGPVLFLPVYSARWLLMLGPFAYLLLISGSTIYQYPELMHDQVAPLFTPFVFLGLISGVAYLITPPNLGDTESSGFRIRGKRFTHSRRTTSIILPVVACSVLLCLIFQPYGPLNDQTSSNFELQSVLSSGSSSYHDLESLVKLIPSSNPNVIFQNNMPEVLPRPVPYHGIPLTTYWTWATPNLSQAKSGQFFLGLPDGGFINVPLEYAISDPYSVWFTGSGPGVNTSMFYFIRTMYESENYGILGEAGGMLLLERGYSQSLRVYIPFGEQVDSNQLFISSSCSRTGIGIMCSNLTGSNAWFGPYMYLSPGRYQITSSMMTTNCSSANHFTLLATANSQSFVFPGGKAIINGSDFDKVDSWQTFSLNITVGDTYGSVEFPADSVYWSGDLSIRNVSITQLAPGNTTYLS